MSVVEDARPTARRRLWWLREALAEEAAAAPHLARAASPLRGTTTADVVIVGGGNTGQWTAWRETEHEPGERSGGATDWCRSRRTKWRLGSVRRSSEPGC